MKTILFLDDDPIYHKLVDKLIGKKYNILHASNISEAKKLIKEHICDLFIIDVMLKGGETGLDFLKEIRKQGIKTLAIILTSLAYEDVKDKLGGTNSFSVVNKHDIGLLDEKIQSALQLANLEPMFCKLWEKTKELEKKCKTLNFSTV